MNDPHYRHKWGDTVSFLNKRDKIVQGVVSNAWHNITDELERDVVYLIEFEGMDLIVDGCKLIYPDFIDELIEL